MLEPRGVSSSPRPDVLVVGAGPAGCAAGITLARAGFRVTVLDRARFPRPKTCGDALSSRAVSYVRSLGAGEALDACPHAMFRRSRVVFSGGHEVLRDDSAHAGVIVGRLPLDAMLVDALRASGATVCEGVNVREAVLDGARVVGVRDDRETHLARAVIAADGPGSIAWPLLKAERPRGRTLAVSATAYVRHVPGPTPDDCNEHFLEPELPDGYGWIFPAVEGVRNIGVYQRVDGYRRTGVTLAKALDAFMARHRDRFAHAELVGEVRTWQLPLSDLRAPAGVPGLLTVGDAGRHVDPLSGEGIWQALHSGVLAAEALIASKGEADEATVRGHARRMRREIDGTATVRGVIQDAMTVAVTRGWTRSPLLTKLLQRTYGEGAFDTSRRG